MPATPSAWISCGITSSKPHRPRAKAPTSSSPLRPPRGNPWDSGCRSSNPFRATRAKLRTSSAIYIAPTKALAADQLANLEKLIVQGMRPATYDGDTSQESKDWARRHANIIFTNPDMLHRGILPQHERFSRLFKSLRYIVIDEAHRYRGVFGSHVALILRRLLRIAAHYGAHPVVIGASATMANPDQAFSKLTGTQTSTR